MCSGVYVPVYLIVHDVTLWKGRKMSLMIEIPCFIFISSLLKERAGSFLALSLGRRGSWHCKFQPIGWRNDRSLQLWFVIEFQMIKKKIFHRCARSFEFLLITDVVKLTSRNSHYRWQVLSLVHTFHFLWGPIHCFSVLLFQLDMHATFINWLPRNQNLISLTDNLCHF